MLHLVDLDSLFSLSLVDVVLPIYPPVYLSSLDMLLPWTTSLFFFFNDPAPPELYPLPLHAALPIRPPLTEKGVARHFDFRETPVTHKMDDKNVPTAVLELAGANGPLGTWVASGWSVDETMAADRKSTRLNSSHT